MTTWTGPMRLPEARNVPGRHLTVTPLPDANTPTPRRRRSTYCGHLAIGGKHPEPEQVRLMREVDLRQTKEAIRCELRPGVTLKADWTFDMCLSSWCRGCVFAPYRQAA